MDVTGTLIFKRDAEQVSEKFKKREFIVKVEDGQYQQEISLQLSQDKCSLIDGIPLNQQVQAYFNLRGRKWINKEGKAQWFNTLDCWKVSPIGPMGPDTQQETTTAPASSSTNNDDDLPF